MEFEQFNDPAWDGFVGGRWQKDIDTAVFIRLNYKPYEDGPEFLSKATAATDKLWGALQQLQKQERAKGGVLDMDTAVVSSIIHGTNYTEPEKSLLRIGVDVLPEYRRKGIASALTSRLALEVLARGKVPFYCAAWCNIKSVRNAIRSGFRPAWVAMTAKNAEFVDKMNGLLSAAVVTEYTQE